MSRASRIIAVVDLFAHPETVSRTALALVSRQPGTELRFAALFDHAAILNDDRLSSAERFRLAEQSLQTRLLTHLTRINADRWPCSLLSGHPAEEISRLASLWSASCILTDTLTARALYSGWFPWQHPSSPPPCPIRIVPPPSLLHLLIALWQQPAACRLP